VILLIFLDGSTMPRQKFFFNALTRNFSIIMMLTLNSFISKLLCDISFYINLCALPT